MVAGFEVMDMESPIAEKSRGSICTNKVDSKMEVENTNKASSSHGTEGELTTSSNSEESSVVKTNKVGNLFENLVRNHQNSIKALFQRKKSSKGEGADSPEPLPFLSPLANSVVSRSSRILKTSAQELQHRFDTELPENVRQQSEYARNFLEFCSFETLDVMTRDPDYLGDKEFRRLMFDMMLAWEIPGSESEKLEKELTPLQEIEDGDGWSLFYSSSTNTAVQVDDKNSIGQDAFAKIAPGCAAIADAITVHNLFDALTVSSGRRLHFLIYDKYLRSLDKVIKSSKNAFGPSVSYLQLADGEMILDIDGTAPTQPVFQHIGISAWPGRLTLTNYAIYFEALGVGVYDKAVRYDLANDMKQVIKPELTGPLGARIFDKAVMYKSTSVTEPVYMEFPEFKGKSRRDYWLDICLEILRAHKFSRKYGFKEVRQSEIIARATLGILRCRAVREAFNFFSSQYKSLLAFNLAESLPGGDIILETLSSRLLLIYTGSADGANSPHTKQKKILSPVSLVALFRLGFTLLKHMNLAGVATTRGDISVGEVNPFETAVKKSILDTGRAEAAQATVDQVKVEGIDTNFAVMKELLLPVIQTVHRLQFLASWESPFRSMMFLALACLLIYMGWIKYVLPCIFVYFALLMLWRRVLNRGKSLHAFKIQSPPSRNAVEQLLTLQDSIGQVESLIQAGNIVLLKIRALLFAILPQATEKVALFLVFLGVVLALVPLNVLFVIGFFEAFTREMPLRKESSERSLRRLREWWVRIPAAPVELVKDNDKKNK